MITHRKLLAVASVLLALARGASARGDDADDGWRGRSRHGWEAAVIVADRYAAEFGAMNEAASALDALLATDGPVPAFGGTPRQRLDQALEYAAWNLERALLEQRAHRLIQEKAYVASVLQPRLVAALRERSGHFDSLAGRAAFPDLGALYESKAREYRALADGLEAGPVRLPAGFARTGRYIDEAVAALGELSRANRLERALAPGRFDGDAYSRSFTSFYVYFADWRDRHFAGWRASRRRQFEGVVRDVSTALRTPGPSERPSQGGPTAGRQGLGVVVIALLAVLVVVVALGRVTRGLDDVAAAK